MSEPQMTQEQETILDEALKYAQLFEQQAQELWEWGEAFAAKWEKSLPDAEVAATYESEKSDISIPN